MSFLEDLTHIRSQALADLADQGLQKSIREFKDYIVSFLLEREVGIENEFRNKVHDAPKHGQWHVIRMLTHCQLKGMCPTLESDTHRRDLLDRLAVLFPHMTVGFKDTPAHKKGKCIFSRKEFLKNHGYSPLFSSNHEHNTHSVAFVFTVRLPN
jgi:hypothetical protein